MTDTIPTMHFADTLTAQSKKKAPICVGLDPNLSKLPEEISKDASGAEQFCKGIIDAVCDITPCVKPQLASFEVLGCSGEPTAPSA